MNKKIQTWTPSPSIASAKKALHVRGAVKPGDLIKKAAKKLSATKLKRLAKISA